MQRSKANLNTWTDICTDTTAPFTCAFDTTTGATPDGSYDFRAVMTSTPGLKTTSATLAARAIDNTPVRGADVQSADKAGGKPGLIEAGDTLTLTYSSAMKASTLISGWSGAGSAPLYFLVSNVNHVVGIALTTNSSGTVATGLGTVNPGGTFANRNKTVTFAATATLSSAAGGGSVVTILLGPGTGNGLRTVTSSTTMKWTPSAAATDLAGNPSSIASVTESGALDQDF